MIRLLGRIVPPKKRPTLHLDNGTSYLIDGEVYVVRTSSTLKESGDKFVRLMKKAAFEEEMRSKG